MKSIHPGTRCFWASSLRSLTLLVAMKMKGPGMCSDLRFDGCGSGLGNEGVPEVAGVAQDGVAKLLPVALRTEDPLAPWDRHRVGARVVPDGRGVGVDCGLIDDVGGDRGRPPGWGVAGARMGAAG